MASEISRDALIIYLYNLRTLETAVHIDEQKKEKLQSDCWNRNYSLERYHKSPPVIPATPNINLPKKMSFFDFIKSLIGCIVISAIPLLFLASISQESFIIGVVITLIGFIIFNIGVNSAYETELKDYNQIQQDYENQLNNYYVQLDIYNQNKQQKVREKETLNQQAEQLVKEIEAEQNQLKSALSRAYSANIIPLQFRNIEGVYYLYDYLSSSQQSLQSALIQANLEAIKKKLDEVIRLQGDMIIQQAQTNKMIFSQNQQMIASLQRIQESASNTEQNSIVASQYAQISASNSETALIMQREQLAYQKADYWMKYHDIL